MFNYQTVTMKLGTPQTAAKMFKMLFMVDHFLVAKSAVSRE